MELTENLKLKKPGLNSYIQISDINDNMDILDEAVGELKQGSTIMEDLQTENKTLAGAINEALDKANQAFQSASDGKQVIATAITGKGIPTSSSDTFQKMATNIDSIETDKTGDATATAADILAPKDAYVKGQKIKGTIPSKGAATITPTTSAQTIAANQYLSGAQTIAGVSVPVEYVLAGITIAGAVGTMPNRGALNETITSNNGQVNIAAGYYTGGVIKAIFANLIASNIKEGVNIGSVVGTLIEGFPMPPSQKMLRYAVNIRVPVSQVNRDKTYMLATVGQVGSSQHTITGLFHIKPDGRALKLLEFRGDYVNVSRTFAFGMSYYAGGNTEWAMTYVGNEPDPYIEYIVFEA